MQTSKCKKQQNEKSTFIKKYGFGFIEGRTRVTKMRYPVNLPDCKSVKELDSVLKVREGRTRVYN